METQMGQIKTTEELNEKLQKITYIAHCIAQQASGHCWDAAAIEYNKMRPLTGDEILSGMTTLCADFLARWVVVCKTNIADEDDTGYSTNDILNTIFDGARAMLSIKKVETKPKDHGEIKRIY